MQITEDSVEKIFTEFQLDNLKKVTRYLKHVLPKTAPFSMSRFEPELPLHRSRCVIGYAPAAGITRIKNECWSDFALRAFGVDYFVPWQAISSPAGFLFSGEWKKYDDTLAGAVARLEYVLSRGSCPRVVIPPDAEAEEYADAFYFLANYAKRVCNCLMF